MNLRELSLEQSLKMYQFGQTMNKDMLISKDWWLKNTGMMEKSGRFPWNIDVEPKISNHLKGLSYVLNAKSFIQFLKLASWMWDVDSVR